MVRSTKMDAVRKRSLQLLLKFIFKGKTVDDAVKFHNDLLDLFFDGYGDDKIGEMKITEPMDPKEMWIESRFLLYWVLFELNKEMISTEIADKIFQKFNHAYNSDRRFSII